MQTDACSSFTLHGGGCWSTLRKDEIHEQYRKDFQNSVENKKIIDVAIQNVRNYMTHEDLPVGLRLQDKIFRTKERNAWWNTRKGGYNGYTYTTGPLLPLGPHLKEAFNSDYGDIDKNTFTNRNDISTKYVDAEFLQSQTEKGKFSPDTAVQEKIKRFHTNAAFPVEIHHVDPLIGAHHDFSGEVYRALLNILKASLDSEICSGDLGNTNPGCLAWNFGIVWDNTHWQFASYELEQEIKRTLPQNLDKSEYCAQTDTGGTFCYNNCFSCSLCQFGYNAPDATSIQRRMRVLYNAINYTLYNATRLYEAASEDIRDWEQNNSGFESCAPVNGMQSTGINVMNITLNFPPEANGLVKEIGIYTIKDNHKNFLSCNLTMSGLFMSVQIEHTPEFYLQVLFREHLTTYNVTIEHASFVSTFQSSDQTFSATHNGTHFSQETLKSVAVDWKLQNEPCALGFTDEIQTIHDFNSLHAKMSAEFETNTCENHI
jgi:hypothetical protein